MIAKLTRVWDRATSWFMHPLFDKLTVLLTVGLASWAIISTVDVAGDAEHVAHTNAALTGQLALALDAIVISSREGCERSNDIRESAGLLLRQQYNSTRRLLKNVPDLGPLERYRALTVRQQEDRRRALRQLELKRDDKRDETSRYRLDCVKSHPPLAVASR